MQQYEEFKKATEGTFEEIKKKITSLNVNIDDFFKDQEKTNDKFEDKLFDLFESNQDMTKKFFQNKKELKQKDL